MTLRHARWGLMLAAALTALGGGVVRAEERGEPSDKQLFRRGAELWPVTCAGCHKARPGGEWSPDQWDTIIMHMRAVANLPADDARAIHVFLRSR